MTTNFDDLAASLASHLTGKVLRDFPLGERTTYRVGGAAAVGVEPAGIEDLALLSDAVQREAASGNALHIVTIGKGSNMLVADEGFAGIAIYLGEAFTEVIIDGTAVIAGAAASLPTVARQTVTAGLTGFEWAVGVPGTVGGACRMNAGGHGSDMATATKSVTVFDLGNGQLSSWDREQLGFGYRMSALSARHCVVACHLELEVAHEDGHVALGDIVRWRRDHQPGGPNAGSVFTNPPGDSAGRLIDACGAKGMRVGTASVSTKHANFIQADDDGQAADVLALMHKVRDVVEAETGIRLHPETHLVGFGEGFSDPSPSGGTKEG